MRKLLASLLLIAITACSSRGGAQSTGAPGHGRLTLAVEPNPIEATKVSGDTYQFPFTVIIREVGGSAVTITDVRADVLALGGLRISSATYDAAELVRRGFSTQLPANGELRYSFSERKNVSDDRLFTSVSADLTVNGTDNTGVPTSARTTVTVTR
ncbi:MAG TPA: hypothetical protein VHL58_16390 [Thermoanaerobaculia bacterium]|nr:hypothetical protein [Thermoanaerobaculia bacterium]